MNILVKQLQTQICIFIHVEWINGPQVCLVVYVDVKDIHKGDLQDFSESVSKLPTVSFNDKYKKIRDVFMLFCIYNIRFIQQNIKLLCYLFNYKLSDVSHYIRKSKPGFQHDNYMKMSESIYG